MEGPPMTFVFHHGGKFKKDEGGYLYYEPDHTEVLMGVEADTLDVFFVRGYYVELGYAEARECWWKSPGVPLEYGLRRLATDDDLVAMVKDCRRNFNLINLYFEHGVSEPCVVDEQEGDVPKINPTQTKRHQSQPTKLPSQQKASSESTKASAEGSRLSQPSKLPSQSKKFSTKSTKEPSQPSKLPTQPTKQPIQPTKEPTKPTGPSLKPTGPSAKPTRPTTKPSRPSSQPTKKSHEPVQTSSQQRKAYSQPTKPTPATTQPKGKAKVTTTTRAGRHVKAIEVEEDSDSHDSYESAEDSLYKPPKVLGDDESSSDSDDGVNSTRLNKKREVKEKHKPAKTRLAEKEIETDDSSYEASESEDESDSDLEDNPLEDNDSDLNSWHSEDSGQELDSDEESPTVYPQYNDKAKFGDLKFEVSMIFKSKEHFMHATRDYTIQLGRNILFTKNDNVRVRAVCKAEGCPWVVYCARSKQDGSWQIKTLVDNHICPRRRKNRAATQQWTLSKLVPKLRKHPTMRHREVYEWFVRKCNVNLNSTCITRALKAARKVVEGDEVAQYGLIWDYANELLTSNPGSTVQVGVIPMPQGPPQFERFYVCLDACKKGFKAGCRPMIGLDGAFLKTLHGGQILTACAQDANNHIFVVAYAIVDVENKDNWKWFLELLQSDLSNFLGKNLCLISDMQKGLIPAVKEVMPMAQHRFCVWHLWRNFSKQWGSTELKDLVWECARSRTRNEFERNMKRVKVINEQAWQYLEKWPKEAWTKAYFSEDPKNDNICNNACESFNAKIKHERTKPILTLAEEVRRIIMKSMVDNKLKLNTYQGILPPVQQSRLEAMTKLSSHWAPQWCGDEKEELFEVHGWPTNMVVDLGKHTCTCRFWQLTGMPCMHAISAIQDKNGKRIEEYCHELLTMEAYKRTYCFNVNPVKGQDLWEKTSSPAPVPPPIKPKPGRPTKKRRKDKGEQPVGSGTKMKRKYNPIRCMFCGEVGHNKRSCAKKKKEDAEDQARQMQLQLALPNGPAPPTDDPNTNNEVQSHSPPPPPVQPEPAVEVNQPVQDTQLPVQDIQGEKRGRPPKLHVIKKKARSNASTQSSVAISAETLKGTTSATAKKMQTFMTFVPTPGFKRPRKKD